MAEGSFRLALEERNTHARELAKVTADWERAGIPRALLELPGAATGPSIDQLRAAAIDGATKERVLYLTADGRALRDEIERSGAASSQLPAEPPPKIIKWESDMSSLLARRQQMLIQFQHPGPPDPWNHFAATVGAAYDRINRQLEALESNMRVW
jgi:hypothetical protein